MNGTVHVGDNTAMDHAACEGAIIHKSCAVPDKTYKCPYCGAYLTYGDEGFFHAENTDCRYKTADIYREALKYITESGHIAIPRVPYPSDYKFMTYISPDRMVEVQHASLANIAGCASPDIALVCEGKRLIIKLCGISDEDRQRIIGRGYSALLVKLPFSDKAVQSPEEILRPALGKGVRAMEWIINARMEACRADLLSLSKKLYVTELRYAPLVHGCPRAIRTNFSADYAHLYDDCSECPYLVDVYDEPDGEERYVHCIGHLRIGNYYDYMVHKKRNE